MTDEQVYLIASAIMIHAWATGDEGVPAVVTILAGILFLVRALWP